MYTTFFKYNECISGYGKNVRDPCSEKLAHFWGASTITQNWR